LIRLLIIQLLILPWVIPLLPEAIELMIKMGAAVGLSKQTSGVVYVVLLFVLLIDYIVTTDMEKK